MTGCTKARRYWLAALLLGLLQLARPAAAQDADSAAAPRGEVVGSQLTARHRRLPGSTLYVRPAPGYVTEESLNGLSRPDGSLIEVLRVPEANFLKVRGLVVEQYLAERGTHVQQRELTFNGYPAVFGEGSSLEAGKNLMVLGFGDSSSFVLVFGLYPAADTAARGEQQRMLLTSYYDARGTVPPLELAPFVISLAGTPFQLLEARPADKTYVFGPAGSAGAVPDTFATRFTVQVLPVMPAPEARQRLLRLAQSLTTPGALLQSQERQLPPGGSYGYEVSGQSSLRGRRNSFYQLIRTDEDATLLFHGVVYGVAASAAKASPKPPPKSKTPAAKPAAPADPVADFRKVAATLRMKR
ncbi:hypothetical protein LJ737_16845 [Hymenobacter sp. 15J16-1T3B]|uniref:hypothetical protein n=1 Tax=Hymenobacter sp. 15J16-1T3B TaxID=2886941 RepID=UPI001D1274C6|nr:hypothetical protein [Hymenobacter sp. 15J16-1T3B]MCC3158913.1 hypothetical protein [Hymenobacter sp. 15J16-1T3B]